MAIKKGKNKFEEAINELNSQEEMAQEKAEKVVRVITGSDRETRIIDVNHKDGTVTTRTIKVPERRKSMPIYIPETLYEQFAAINSAYGKSNNSAICEMIRDYVTAKKSVLNEM